MLTKHPTDSESDTPEILIPRSVAQSTCKHFGKIRILYMCGEGHLGPQTCWDYLAVFPKAAASVRDSLIFVILAPDK